MKLHNETAKEETTMQEFTKHYHCHLCGESYPTKATADECFWGHSELEILRWVAFELVSNHHFAEKNEAAPCTDTMCFTNDFVKKLNEKFKVAEIDENGLVWSLAIKGKRI